MDNTKKIYIYPDVEKATNEYIINFHKCFLDANYKVCNRLPKLRLANLLFNIDSDIFIFHWIDVLPSLRYGKIQSYFYLGFLTLLNFLGKKIVWVMHNKTSHSQASDQFLVEKLMHFTSKYANHVLVHANEGEKYYLDKYGIENKNKLIYLPHPVYTTEIINSNREIIWDIIIWGSVSRYKNILEFLKYISDKKYYSSKKILVCGKCDDLNYINELKMYLNNNIQFENKFYSNDELKNVIKKSNIILFTYGSETVISSGALIYSLNFCKPIIGPKIGNFAELPDFVNTYNEFSQIEKLLENLKSIDEEKLDIYLKNNTWEKFPSKFMNLI